MKLIYKTGFFLILWLVSFYMHAKGDYVSLSKIDFIHYKAQLEPNFKTKTISGRVDVELVAKTSNVHQLTFSAKYKKIYSVKSNTIVTAYHLEEEKLVVTFK